MTLQEKIEAQRAAKAAKQARLDDRHNLDIAQMTGPVIFDGIVNASGEAIVEAVTGPSMYALEDAPTLAQIIARSAVCHPSMLAEALEDQAKEDRRFAATRSMMDQPSIRAHAMHCETGAKAARGGSTAFDPSSAADWALMPLGVQIVTANIAAKLQCLPRHILTQAVILSDEGR